MLPDKDARLQVSKLRSGGYCTHVTTLAMAIAGEWWQAPAGLTMTDDLPACLADLPMTWFCHPAGLLMMWIGARQVCWWRVPPFDRFTGDVASFLMVTQPCSTLERVNVLQLLPPTLAQSVPPLLDTYTLFCSRIYWTHTQHLDLLGLGLTPLLTVYPVNTQNYHLLHPHLIYPSTCWLNSCPCVILVILYDIFCLYL